MCQEPTGENAGWSESTVGYWDALLNAKPPAEISPVESDVLDQVNRGLDCVRSVTDRMIGYCGETEKMVRQRLVDGLAPHHLDLTEKRATAMAELRLHRAQAEYQAKEDTIDELLFGLQSQEE